MCTRRLIPIWITLFVILPGYAETGTTPTTGPTTIPATRPSTDEFEPRKDVNSKSGYYIPRDLDDALVEVDRIFVGAGTREKVLRATEDDMIDYHMGFGMWMRNNWGLWGGSRLAEFFNGIGIHHPDDMTGIILHSYWRKLHGKPIDLDGQVKHYKEYWQKQKGG
jgi:hypothetical protein